MSGSQKYLLPNNSDGQFVPGGCSFTELDEYDIGRYQNWLQMSINNHRHDETGTLELLITAGANIECFYQHVDTKCLYKRNLPCRKFSIALFHNENFRSTPLTIMTPFPMSQLTYIYNQRHLFHLVKTGEIRPDPLDTVPICWQVV